MSEIKFRAWDGKQMHKVCRLGLHGFSTDLWSPDPVSCDVRRTKDLTIMQYTGLHDKNGKEIYEGDIVVRDGYIWFDDGKPNYQGTVEWVFSAWQVIAHCVNPEKRGISDGINYGLNDEGWEEGEKTDWEVIGNIYEKGGDVT